MKYNLILIALLVMAILPMVSAIDNFGTFKQGDCIKLIQTCANCTGINITSVIAPNGTQVMGLVVMSKTGTEYNATFCNTSSVGTYNVNGVGDIDGINEVWQYTFTITYGGISNPDGSVAIFFSIGYILFLFGFIFLFIYSLGHAVQVDFDLKDLAINFGSYFGFVIFYFLSGKYFAESLTQELGSWALDIGAITFIILPTIYFILTLTIGSWMNRRVKGVDY